MSRPEEVDDHPLWDELSSFCSLLSEMPPPGTASALAIVNRLSSIATELNRRLGSCDQDFLTLGLLGEVHSQVAPSAQAVAAFQSDEEIAHLNGIASRIDAMALLVGRIPTVSTVDDLDALHETTTRIRRSIGQYSRHIEEEYEAVKALQSEAGKRADELAASIARETERVDTFLSAGQTQFNAAENARTNSFQEQSERRAAKFEEQTAKQLERHEQELSAAKAAISDALDEASDATRAAGEVWETKRSELSEEYANYLSEAKVTNETVLNEQAAAGKRIIDSLASLQSDAETQVGIIANVGMSGGYQKVANQERLGYWIWTGIGALGLGGFIWFAVASYGSAGPTFEWGRMAGRIFASVSFGTMAAFAARFASHHKEAERRARRFELEMASIGPYLASLPAEMQADIKRELAYRLFGQAAQAHEKPSPPSELKQTIVEAVETVVKNVKP